MATTPAPETSDVHRLAGRAEGPLEELPRRAGFDLDPFQFGQRFAGRLEVPECRLVDTIESDGRHQAPAGSELDVEGAKQFTPCFQARFEGSGGGVDEALWHAHSPDGAKEPEGCHAAQRTSPGSRLPS